MDGRTITRYLRELCSDIDGGRPLKPFLSARRVLAPAVIPALFGLSLGLGGCDALEMAGCGEERFPAQPAYAAPPPVQEPVPLSERIGCGDGEDNDHDGLVDCADPECAGLAPCPSAVQDRIAPPPTEEYGAPRDPGPGDVAQPLLEPGGGGTKSPPMPDLSEGTIPALGADGDSNIVYGRPFEEPDPENPGADNPPSESEERR